MKVVHADEVEWFGHVGHREGGVDFKRLLQGEDCTADNFELNIARVQERYTTPRHRHNFDQVRFVLSGAFGFGKGLEQKAGSVGYFPEGCHYQQDGRGESWTLLLQTASASGAPYISYQKLRETVAELMRTGTFNDGVYTCTRAQDGKLIKQDGFEAAWEHATGLELEYPRPRYDRPILMEPQNFQYVPIDAEPGVARKHLGRFTERELEIGFLHLAAGARHRFAGGAGDHLFYVLSGHGTVANAAWRSGSAVHLGANDDADFLAGEPAEIYYLRLPTRTAGR